jgi:hypothetical protein
VFNRLFRGEASTIPGESLSEKSTIEDFCEHKSENKAAGIE